MEIFGKQSDKSHRINKRAAAPLLEQVWMPSHGSSGVIEPIRSTAKIRKIGALLPDIVTRLRTIWFGRLYISYLKQYAIVHWIAQWIWRNLYPIYIRLSLLLTGKRLPLTKLSGFAKKRGITTYKLADAAHIETSMPKVFPASDQIYLAAPHDRYTFPEIYVATIKNALVYGGTNLVLADGEAVCHDLFDLERDYTSEELYCRILIDPKRECIQSLLHKEAPEPIHIPVAATFVDACAQNYAHWLTEVLPRIVVFCSDERFKDVPIVVNDGLHQNIMESLLLVTGADREIIAISTGRALFVDELYITSVAGYVPFERRTNKLANHSHGVFSACALEILRNHLDAPRQKIEKESWPEKIFLRRNSGARKVTNTKELEKLLIARGYVAVEPEKLTFLQQIQLFKNAKKIVAPTGAALSNAIFCTPGAHVVVLMAKHERMIYRYWANMLAPLQIKVSYVLGNIVKGRGRGIHGDFFVDPADLIDLFVEIEKN